MDPIRLATPEELAAIEKEADFDPRNCTAWTFGKINAIMRLANEVDPIFFPPDTPDSKKAAFVWGVENMLRMAGVPFYYFNIAAEDEQWQRVIKNWGATQISKGPEFRFKKVLS